MAVELGAQITPDMLSLARAHAPEAQLVLGSIWDVDIPRHPLAICAVGEVFCYATEGHTPSLSRFAELCGRAYRALEEGGVFLFDVSGPGRSGPLRRRERTWEHDGTILLLEEVESPQSNTLVRSIRTFVPCGTLHRLHEEQHTLVLYDLTDIRNTLENVGLTVRQVDEYAGVSLLLGWSGFVATKEIRKKD